jgi:tryptophan synthase alpha chain
VTEATSTPVTPAAPGRTGAERIEDTIRAAGASGRPALAAFLTAGYPDLDGFASSLSAVAGVADIVEIGVPFSDPMADGVTIQRSSRGALQAGVTLPWILDQVRTMQPTTPIVLMSYLNPLLAFGADRLAEVASEAGVSGLIVPDLPFEECAVLRVPLDSAGIALIQLVTPVTPPDRLQALCGESRGFVYAVTSTGTTGGTKAGGEGALDYLDAVHDASSLPVLAGFGVRSAAQIQALAGHVDGVIVGSALVEVLEAGEDPAAFLRSLLADPAAGKEAAE